MQSKGHGRVKEAEHRASGHREVFQAPSNSQSAGAYTPTPKGGEYINDKFDFMITNEPNQFNCFMNSII